MKIYLAARYSRRSQMQMYADELWRAGHSITSRWIKEPHCLGLDEDDDNLEPELAGKFAMEDVNDLRAADVVIAFTEEPAANWTRGGRHVEFGIAVEAGKNVYVVGPRENIFYALPQVKHYPTWSELYRDVFSSKREKQQRK